MDAVYAVRGVRACGVCETVECLASEPILLLPLLTSCVRFSARFRLVYSRIFDVSTRNLVGQSKGGYVQRAA